MSTPTFDGIDLTTRGEKQIAHPPRVRTYMGQVPGVEGVYTQENPVGSRMITVRGLLSTAGGTRNDALSLLQADIEELQGKEGLVKDYVGTDGTTYTDTMLNSYRAGEIETGKTTGLATYEAVTYTAVAPVTAVLIHTVPSVTA